MKKRIAGLIAAIALLLGLSVVFAACGQKDEKADYSVTVLSPAEMPVSGVTVKWNSSSKTAGSAQTDEDGKATATLPLGSYTVALENYGQGYGYTPVSVSATMRDVEMTLSVSKVTYRVTVTDKANAPAKGVTVTWTQGAVGNATIAGTAVTGNDGVASRELDYGDYSVTLSNLPSGNVYSDGAKAVTGANPNVTFALRDGVNVDYSVTVRSEGGLLFKKHSVSVYNGNALLTSGTTNDNGVFSFSAVAGNYTARAAISQDGYDYTPAQLTGDVRNAELIFYSDIIPVEYAPTGSDYYVIGDIFHDYTFRTPYRVNGKYWESNVSEILKTKKALIINNWGTNCSWCTKEMPYMQEVYEMYKDDVEMVAVSNYPSPSDSDSTIANFYQSYGYTFPLMRDANGFASKFAIEGWPTTVVIDRYGAIARIESGAIVSADAWERLILKYIGEDYVQTFVPGDRTSDSINDEISKPDITVPENHYEELGKVLNDENLFPVGASVTWRGETEYEMAWPFLYGTVDDVSPDDPVVYASNSGKANSIAILYATVNVAAGKVFTFDYYSDTEENEDVLSMVWDGRIVKQISGKTDGWTTCYLYSDITDGEHTLSIAYIKDGSRDHGKDNVYFKNVRFVELEDIDSADMLRCAAYGTPEENATVFPYYAEVKLNEEDGYYHVDTSKLQNSEYAGNDASPLLLANLTGVTPWLRTYSISQLLYAKYEDTGEYAFDCEFTIDGVTRDYRNDLIEYANAANASDVADCVPVNKKLHDMLVEFMKSVHKASGDDASSHENEWLEVCYFYSHYGEGKPVGNPIIGLLKETAIPVTEGTHTADLTRNVYPFPTSIFTFTPETSGVYLFESLIPKSSTNQQYGQIVLYDDDTPDNEYIDSCGTDYIVRDGVNEHNFKLYHYLVAGHKYYIELAFQMQDRGSYQFKISNEGASVTQLVPASADLFSMVLDDEGNFNGQIFLAGAVEYQLDPADGYYHAMNPDGTQGNVIYLDLEYASTMALGYIPIKTLVDRYLDDPNQDDDKEGVERLDYKFFDFRYRVVFYSTEVDGKKVLNYNDKVDMAAWAEENNIEGKEKYKDCTDIVKGWIENQVTEGEYAGMIPVTQEVVDVMMTFIEMRVNSMTLKQDTGEIDDFDRVHANEWLRFCWYTRIYNAQNP